MLWIPVIAAGAAALIGKALARQSNGELARCAVTDPAGVRTMAAFATAAPRDVMRAVAEEISRRVGYAVELAHDAVRARGIDVVRLAHAGDTYTLTLTRAWTGPQLDARAAELLEHLHTTLAAHPAISALGWHARQDRALADRRPYPFDG